MLLHKISGSYHATLPPINLEQQQFYLVIVNGRKLKSPNECRLCYSYQVPLKTVELFELKKGICIWSLTVYRSGASLNANSSQQNYCHVIIAHTHILK